MATPRMVQWLGGWFVGSLTNITKLVECPVVASTPLRSTVLYNGQL